MLAASGAGNTSGKSVTTLIVSIGLFHRDEMVAPRLHHGARRDAQEPEQPLAVVGAPLAQHARLLQQRAHRVGRQRALLEPGARLLRVDLDARRIGARVVVPERRDEPAVPGRPRVRDDDPEVALPLPSHAPQSNASSHSVRQVLFEGVAVRAVNISPQNYLASCRNPSGVCLFLPMPQAAWLQGLITVGVGAVSGGITNAVAVWMLFHPYEARGLGPLKLHGAIPKNKARLAKSIGKTVGQRLLTEEDRARQLSAPGLREAFDRAITVFLDQMLNTSRGTLRAELPPAVVAELERSLEPLAERLAEKLADFVEGPGFEAARSEEHTSELQSRLHLVCRLLLEKKKKELSVSALTKSHHH